MQIKQLFFLLIFNSYFNYCYCFQPEALEQHPTFILMLDPAGDSQNLGRTIDDSFERSLTLYYAQAVKETLEAQYPWVQVMITRNIGQTKDGLCNANIANRLSVNVYISINFYADSNEKPSVYLYQFSYNDDLIKPITKPLFYRFDQAHLISIDYTNALLKNIYNQLTTQEYKKLFICHDSIKIPFKPLLGIKSLAFGIEFGLKNSQQWKDYVAPLIETIKPLITNQNTAL